MAFSDKIKFERKQKRMSQKDLALAAGITTRSIQNYESGRRYPNSIDITAKIASALGTTCEALLGEDDGNYTYVGLIGNIACGPLSFADENIEEFYRFPSALTGRGTFFMLRAKGDSMIEAGIDDGDIVLIKQQAYAESGDIVVAIVDDDSTLKRYYPEPAKHRVRLHPENSSLKDIIVNDCTIQGVAIKVIKSL